MVRDIIASGNGCKVWEYEEMGISGNGNGIGMKWIWYLLFVVGGMMEV